MGYHWFHYAPEQGLVAVDYRPGRGQDGPARFLKGYTGLLPTDGYVVYDMFDRLPGIKTFAHARRKSYDAAIPSWPSTY